MRDCLLNIFNICLSGIMLQNISDILFLFLLVLQVFVLIISIIKTLIKKDTITSEDLEQLNEQINNLKEIIKDDGKKE